MAKSDPRILAHLEWLGYVRPMGLVVSAPALVRAGAILDQHDSEGQRLLRECLNSGNGPAGHVRETGPLYGGSDQDTDPQIGDFRKFAASVLGWRFSPKGYAGTPEAPIPPELEISLPETGDMLRPDYAVRELEPKDGEPSWQLLVRILPASEDFDVAARGGRLDLSPHSRMERLLRSTEVPAGVLFNGRALRLMSAPHGESSGWLEFRVADMSQTAGRPICSAMRMLLSEERLLSLPRHERLRALLAESRKFQNEVSEKLAEQVLHALYEFLRGFQAADEAAKGSLLHQVLTDQPNEVYHALLTVILRLVFLLYAEERDMLPQDETFLRFYSLAGLYERLREDAALYPDTMDQRFGAWAQLLSLFRMIYHGAAAAGLNLPPRHGELFEPDRFPFLEGRGSCGASQIHERIEPPLVPDGTIYRALEKLLVLDGERISYRALDVEQIGSVYETMMGFCLETTVGRSVAIRSHRKDGASAAVNLDELLAEAGANRPKWLQDRTDHKLTDKMKKAVVAATTLEDLHASLLPLIDRFATPDIVPRGAMVLQPGEERRRSGSHYTPRELTEPIVRTTLDPLLARLSRGDGKPPLPEAILDLKICDPAMGSGAFLVEACRYLGEALVEAWHVSETRPAIPPDEDELVFARRLVAQRCLYGVDRNPVAVDLAKMSIWLVTLAKDHALTFMDHALRHGDSLVGLSRNQIEAFNWQADGLRFKAGLEIMQVREHLAKVSGIRRRIREASDDVPDRDLRDLWDAAQFELSKVRLLGDLVIAAYFESEKPKEREAKRLEFATAVINNEAENWCSWLDERRHADPPLVPFHWEIEFPEVFERDNPGFDAFVGNPPFQGGTRLSETQGSRYMCWLLQMHEGTTGRTDLVAHFFRRTFSLLRRRGAFGLIATNTISQGDTRAGGLRWICKNGGEIYSVRKRIKWPGMAVVVVSVVHVMKGNFKWPKYLDGREVSTITAFLFHRGGNDDPDQLIENSGRSFLGDYVLGMGFTFDDTDTKGIATPIAEMNRLLSIRPDYREAIFPYIGGEEVNSSPIHAHHRYIINFDERSEEECRSKWPKLFEIVERKVKPERLLKDEKKYPRMVQEWWKYWNNRQEMHKATARLSRVLVIARVGQMAAFTFLPRGMVYSDQIVVFAFSNNAAFCALQSRPHEIWARFFGSSMKDDLRYTPSDCFETFPFPENWEMKTKLETMGKAYYDYRAELMVRNNEGMTKTYNRFHDPNENDPDILRLRELHATMDRAVLDAYGWHDLMPSCEFLLDYEINEEEWGDKKKPYRYRWPDDVQAEVLARLLELNSERAHAEARAGARDRVKQGRKKIGRCTVQDQSKGDLFS